VTHDPASDHAHLVLIGRLAVAAGQIESTMEGIAATLVSPRPSAVGYAVTRSQQFARLVSLARTAAESQLTSEGSPAIDLLAPLMAWIDRADAAMKRRNQLMHAVWIIYATQRTATLVRRTGEPEGLPVDRMLEDIERAECVADDGSDLWYSLVARYGAFDALIEATRAMDPEGWERTGLGPSDDEAGDL
jgi:hypothetical protein